jgi:hypothetical protein
MAYSYGCIHSHTTTSSALSGGAVIAHGTQTDTALTTTSALTDGELLDLLELVHAEDAPGVLAVLARLLAEARGDACRVCTVVGEVVSGKEQ